MSPAFLALIWWVIPAAGLIGALGYVLWVTKFQSKYRQETNRSIDSFQRFQQTFHDPAGVRVIDHKTGKPVIAHEPMAPPTSEPFSKPATHPTNEPPLQ